MCRYATGRHFCIDNPGARSIMRRLMNGTKNNLLVNERWWQQRHIARGLPSSVTA